MKEYYLNNKRITEEEAEKIKKQNEKYIKKYIKSKNFEDLEKVNFIIVVNNI